MTIAIVLSAHGFVSKELLYTAEIIIGKQKNITWVDLLPSENTDDLFKKYTASLLNLDINSGILFLVDIWGGTPFNAAQRMILNKKNYDIVTGVNVPMLIEVLLVRDKKLSMKELVQIAVQSGSESIKTVTYPALQVHSDSHINIDKPQNKNIANIDTTTHNDIKAKEKLMTISLIRIDDRLIHGQVVTRWAKELNINRIIVVNDDIAKDTIRVSLLTQVTPPGITAHIIDIQKAIRVYNNPRYQTDKVIMLFTNPLDVLRLIEGGVPIPSINIGGMSFQQGKKQIHNAISVNAKDIETFKKLNQIGVNLEVRKVPSDSPIKLMTLIAKI